MADVKQALLSPLQIPKKETVEREKDRGKREPANLGAMQIPKERKWEREPAYLGEMQIAKERKRGG